MDKLWNKRKTIWLVTQWNATEITCNLFIQRYICSCWLICLNSDFLVVTPGSTTATSTELLFDLILKWTFLHVPQKSAKNWINASVGIHVTCVLKCSVFCMLCILRLQSVQNKHKQNVLNEVSLFRMCYDRSNHTPPDADFTWLWESAVR